jgi:hypothetical protein
MGAGGDVDGSDEVAATALPAIRTKRGALAVYGELPIENAGSSS